MRSPVRRLIARAIKEIIRRHGIAARYRGDEFAIILPDTTLQAAEVAERLRVEANVAQLERHFERRIILRIDLPDRELVCGAPTGIHLSQKIGRQRGRSRSLRACSRAGSRRLQRGLSRPNAFHVHRRQYSRHDLARLRFDRDDDRILIRPWLLQRFELAVQ
jgi:hypothetical protein